MHRAIPMAMLMAVSAMSTQSHLVSSVDRIPDDRRRLPRFVVAPGEPVSMQQLAAMRSKNARRKKRRR